MNTEIFSLLKRTEKHNHPIAGPSTENLYTTYSAVYVGGNWHIRGRTRNDYVIVRSWQWGAPDSERVARELGLILAHPTT